MIELHGADFNKKPKRKGAAADRQLSKPQRYLLLWIHSEEIALFAWDILRPIKKGETVSKEDEEIMKSVKSLNTYGVPWSVKRYLQDAPTRSQESSISRRLHSLEARGLVTLRDAAGGVGKKPYTTHLRLTKLGQHAVSDIEKRHGMSMRELSDLDECEIARRKRLWDLKDVISRTPPKKFFVEYFNEHGGMSIVQDGVETFVTDIDEYLKKHAQRLADLKRDLEELSLC